MGVGSSSLDVGTALVLGDEDGAIVGNNDPESRQDLPFTSL